MRLPAIESQTTLAHVSYRGHFSDNICSAQRFLSWTLLPDNVVKQTACSRPI
jgi:hypothetical protein